MAALVAAAVLAWSEPGRADIDLPTVPPAQPEAVTAKTFLGEPVDIPLRGLSRSGLQLQFLIRRLPGGGQLSPVTLTSRNTAVVTYTPDPAAGPGIDRFRYAVRAPTGGVSTPAEVIINVVERPPVFAAPARLDFSPVAEGESTSESFEVRNDGGGRLEGTLSVPPPWTVVGNARYSLGPGDARSFVVSFAPTEARRYADVGTFSHGGGGAEIGLSGMGYAPIEVVPREVRLEGDGRNEVRRGEFLVRNVSDRDRELAIQAPAEVVVQESVKVAARSETQVAVHTRAGFLNALDGWVKMAGGGLNLAVPLRVMPAPANVRVSPEAIDLGTFPAGKYGRAKLTIRNDGGSPAPLRVTLPEGAQIAPDPSYEELAAGQSREFEVSFARPGAAKLDGQVVIDVGGRTMAVSLRARVTDDPPQTQRDNAQMANIAALTNEIPPVREVRMAHTKNSVDLIWKRTSPDAVRYALFLRTMGVGPDGKMAFKYQTLPRVVPRMVRDEVRATLNGLRPGERVTIMIVAYDKAGKSSLPSPPLVVFSKPRAPWNIPWTWLGVAAIAGFVFLLVRERRRRRGVTAEEIEQIYRA